MNELTNDPGDLIYRIVTPEMKRAQAEELATADRKARREKIAARLLAGLYANPGPWNSATLGSPILAAVESADELLAELDRRPLRYSPDGYVHIALPVSASESDLRAAWAAHEERMRQQRAGEVPR